MNEIDILIRKLGPRDGLQSITREQYSSAPILIQVEPASLVARFAKGIILSLSAVVGFLRVASGMNP